MPRYILTQSALTDLSDIWIYTEDRWSETQADRYYHMILSICEDAANQPRSGKNYDDILQGLSGLKAGAHIVFFRKLEGSDVEIIRILHGHMDIRSRMK